MPKPPITQYHRPSRMAASSVHQTWHHPLPTGGIYQRRDDGPSGVTTSTTLPFSLMEWRSADVHGWMTFNPETNEIELRGDINPLEE